MFSRPHRTLAVLAAATLTACMIAPPSAPDRNSRGPDIYRFITAEEPYRQWKKLPPLGKRPEGAPHGPQATVYANPIAAEALEGGTLPMPADSALLVENRGKDETVVSLEMMIKRPDFFRRHGDWYWLRFAPDGEVLKEGAMGQCIRCHKRRRQSDYVFK